MAILLTTSYQKISTITLTYGEIRTYAKYSNQENNITTYQIKSTYYIPTYNSVAFDSATATLDGTNKSYGYTVMYRGETTIQELERTISHNDDGSSPTKNIATNWTASFGGSGSTSADIVFPAIDRYPLLTSAPDFTDEKNPTITFTTTVGFENSTTYACISLTGSLDDVPYREVNITPGTYTFNLTTAERNTLRNATPDSNTLSVIFYLKTVANGNNYFSTLTRQMRIVNANPDVGTPTYTETNSKVVNVLGTNNANTIIENASVVNIGVSPTAQKGSTIYNVSVNHGDRYYVDDTSPYSFSIPVIANSFRINVVDSRGNLGRITATKTFVTYAPVKINSYSFERENPTSSTVIVNLEAVYYQRTFGSTANTPSVKWKLENGNYTTIPSSNYTIDTTNNKLTITDYEITNALSYTTTGQFTIKVEDLLSEASDSGPNGFVLKGIPTFDYGEHDLKVNGDLYIADTNGNNPVNVLDRIDYKILWTNSNPSNQFAGQDMNLSSSDYDFLEIIYVNWTDNQKYSSERFPKGQDTTLKSIFVSSNNGYMGVRDIQYSSDTKLVAGNSYSIISGNTFSVVSNNYWNIPVYVIGYKTGLF